MSKNTIPGQSSARVPRATVLVNGVDLRDALVEVEWESNTFFQADTFRATFATSKLPEGYGPAYFADTAPIVVEIFAGFPADPVNFTAKNLASMFYGQVDPVDWSPDQTTITISGRDLTSKLIDAKSDKKYPNQTASQIVTKLASDVGLTAVVTATSTLVGRYYEIDHVALQDNRTLWDLVCYLAQKEGFVAYVKGKELHFEPPPAADDEPYAFYYNVPRSADGMADANCHITFSRSLTLAKDIVVKVRSRKPGQKTAFTMTAKATHAKSSGETQTYVFDYWGLTSAEAQKKAETIAADLSKHERKATVTGPADNILSRTDVVQIDGTDTSWDQTYFVENIARRYSLEDGYVWTVNLKNHSPESQTSL